MPVPARPIRLALFVLALCASLALIVQVAGEQARHQALTAESQQTREQLNLYAGTLQTLIERFRSLPAVLALDPELRAQMAGPLDEHHRQALNLKLERINEAAHSSTLDLLDHNGLSVAASNWRLPSSYVGHDYSFRPYFTESRSQGTGRFYAVGVTTGVPGYFLAHAIHADDGRFLGAIVVKLEFPELEKSWGAGSDVLLVSDPDGVIFLANHDEWRYRLLGALSQEANERLQQTRQYDRQSLRALAHRQLERLDENTHLTRVDGIGKRRDYLWRSLPLNNEGWTLHLLRDVGSQQSDVTNARIAAAGVWLALVFLGLFLHQRWRIARLRQRSRAELERLVEQRTADLRLAQEGLVQAAKLAALGQMSAALAHEINQPLTAQRMQLASLRLLLEAGQLDGARDVLTRLDEQLQRMAALTGHLKTFARKSPEGLRERVELGHVLQQALELLAVRIRDEGVTVLRAGESQAWVMGDAIRLEQVLINLVRNGLDALRGRPQPHLWLTVQRDGEYWRLDIEDNGSGIQPEDLPQVFDPFFTTKPVGEGLGLGLAVSYGIVHQLGGRLDASNRSEGGASFVLRLPAAEGNTP